MSKNFLSHLDIPDAYISLFDAHQELKGFAAKHGMCYDDVVKQNSNGDNEVAHSSRIKMLAAIEGNDNVEKSVDFINSFMRDKQDSTNGTSSEEVQEQLSL